MIVWKTGYHDPKLESVEQEILEFFKQFGKFLNIASRDNGSVGKLVEMANFYKEFLGSYGVFENEMLAFLTYDEKHHRRAITGVPGTIDRAPESCGLEHVAFSFDSLSDLILAYRQRKKKGINPAWLVNHGPTTSMYYKDPDGNVVITPVENFDSNEEVTQLLKSKEFAENPFGTDFNPEDHITRLEAGEARKLSLSE